MPSLSTDGSHSFVSCGERQTMSVPSGNMEWSVKLGTSRMWQRPKPPRRSETNRMRPFGSQHGKRSLTPPQVSIVRLEPSAFIFMMWKVVFSSHSRVR